MGNRTKLYLLLITLLAFCLRAYLSSSYPPLLWDEAALGYNAYSILLTGKDEFGQTLPLILKSFGDYKPAFYSYLSLPFILIFGLNTLSVRLPSIILGSLLPFLGYLLVSSFQKKSSSRLPLIFALLLAISPFTIHFSRGAWETNILTFELVLAAYFLNIAYRSRKLLFYLLSSFVFSLSLYTYQGGKMMAPIIILLISLVNLKNFRQELRRVLFFALTTFVLALPLLIRLLFSSDSNRLKVVSLFSYPRSTQEINTIIQESSPLDYSLFHHHLIFFSRNFLTRYFNHFSPALLFFYGDWQNPRHSAPYTGVLLYPFLILLPLGIVYLFKNYSKNRSLYVFFTLWLLLAPVPAALTRDSVQIVRAMSLSVPLIFIGSLGLNYLLKLTSSLPKLLNILVTSTLILLFSLSFIYYSDLYYSHMIRKSPNDFLYGYRQAYEYLLDHRSDYDHFIFTDFYGQPYIYYLFYSQYDPSLYQQTDHYVSTSIDTGKVEKIDNIDFRGPTLADLLSDIPTLAIFSHDEVLRQGIDKLPIFKEFIPLSPVNGISTFYAYHN